MIQLELLNESSNKKQCRTCKEYKSKDDFHKNEAKASGLSSDCNTCRGIKRRNYYKNNSRKIISMNVNHAKKRYSRDEKYRIERRIRANIRRFTVLNHKNTLDHFGMEFEEFCKIKGVGENLDHVVPMSWFDMRIEEHRIVCNHWTNFQFLSEKDNLSKSNKYAGRPDNIIDLDKEDIEDYVSMMISLINFL